MEDGAHEWPEQLLDEVYHAKLSEYLAQRSRQNADGHEVETGVEQQVVGRVHDGVEHG